MKNLLLIIALSASFTGMAQTVSFNQVDQATAKPKGNFKTYISKDSTTYSIGDKLTVGQPSGQNGRFVYIQEITAFGDIMIVKAKAANTKTEIKKIKIAGSKRAGFKVTIQSKGMTGITNYFFNIEDAIESGEIISN